MAKTWTLDEIVGGKETKPTAPRTFTLDQAVSGRDALDQAAVEHASFPNQAKAVAKDVAGNLLGVGGQIMDMFTGLPRVASIPGTLGVQGVATAKGVSSKLAGEAGLQYQEQFLPEWTQNSFAKISKALGPEAEEYYNNNGLAQFLQMFGESIEKGGKVLEKKTGYPASFITTAVNQTMDILGLKTARWDAKRALAIREKAVQDKVMERQRRPAEQPFTEQELAQKRFLQENPQFTNTPSVRARQEAFLRENPQFKQPAPEPIPEGTKSVKDTPIIGELPPALDRALEKIRAGERPTLTADELVALREFERGDRPPLILPEKFRDAKGAADPKLLAGLAAFGMGTVIGNYISENPDVGEGLGLALPFIGMGAVKEKGGAWHSEAISRLSEPLTQRLRQGNYGAVMDAAAPSLAEQFKPIEARTNKMVRDYLNKHAGTATDPLKDVEIPFERGTKRWEDVTDVVIKGEQTQGPRGTETQWKANLSDGRYPPDGGYLEAESGRALTSYLSHVGDYLRGNVPADKLPQYDLVRAVKETQKWDADMAKRMAKERADMTSQMPVYKDYGDGYKWVEVRGKPLTATEFQAKGYTLKEVLRAGPAEANYRLFGPDGKSVEGPVYKAPNVEEAWVKAAKEDAKVKTAELLKDEGDQMGHCVGGYCDYVESGDSKIYSLRDSKGKSHVTIEVRPEQQYQRGLKSFLGAPEYKLVENIKQIKGKQNRAPVSEYLPYVQDFVKSGKWGEVGDLENAGLTRALDDSIITIEEARQRYGATPGEIQRGQRGSIDPELLKTMGAAGLGGLAGYFAQEQIDRGHPAVFGVLGALTGVGIRSAVGRAVMKEAAETADHIFGPISTRTLNKLPPLFRRQQQTEMNMLKDKAEVILAAEPLFIGIEKLGDKGKVLEAALTKENFKEVEAELARTGTPAMKKAYTDMRSVLSYVADKAKELGRISKVDADHFPRVVKDYKGLMEALNLEARQGLEKMLFEAEKKMVTKHSRPLSETERTKIIEQYLRMNGRGSFQPNYAKSRKIQDVTDGILPFYHKPVEAFHIRMKEAIEDIEKAKFFGASAVNKVDGGKTYLDVDKSIAGIMEKYEREGKLSNEDAAEMRSIFQSRYKGGERYMSPRLQDAKNIISAGLLGNIPAAIGQYADVGGIVAIHEMKPTLKALAAQLQGKSKLLPRDYGLIDHISQEFISSRPSTKALNWIFSHSVLGKHFSFGGADVNMKQLSLNAGLENGFAMAKKGDPRLANRYEAVFEEDFPKLVADLKEGKVTPLTREYAWLEINRHQPLTRFEQPQWDLDNPNWRILKTMKTWAIKQGDLIRRDAYNEIKAGRKAQGFKNLLRIGLGLGMGGATIAQIQNFILGREKEMEVGDVFENAAKTFALNEYTRNDLVKGDVIKALIAAGTPPYKVFDDIIKGVIFIDEPEARNKLVRYVPDIGPVLYNQLLGGKEQWNKRERQKEKRELREESMTEGEREQRREMRRLTPGEREAKRKELREQKKYEIKPVRSIKPINSFIEDKDIYSDTAGRGIINKRGQVERILERADERFSKQEHIAPLKFEKEYTQRALGKIRDPKERRRIEGLIDREINLREQRRNRAAFKRKIEA